MMRNNLLRLSAWVITSTLGLSACTALNSSDAKTLPVTEIYSASTCNINEQGITAIENKESLREVLKKANSHRLDSKPKDLSSIDFDASHVYLITMGIKPNAGYALKKTGTEASLENGVLHLPIQVELPSKAGMYAQMMTSPCTLISLPAGTYNTIAIEGWETLK